MLLKLLNVANWQCTLAWASVTCVLTMFDTSPHTAPHIYPYGAGVKRCCVCVCVCVIRMLMSISWNSIINLLWFECEWMCFLATRTPFFKCPGRQFSCSKRRYVPFKTNIEHWNLWNQYNETAWVNGADETTVQSKWEARGRRRRGTKQKILFHCPQKLKNRSSVHGGRTVSSHDQSIYLPILMPCFHQVVWYGSVLLTFFHCQKLVRVPKYAVLSRSYFRNSSVGVPSGSERGPKRWSWTPQSMICQQNRPFCATGGWKQTDTLPARYFWTTAEEKV